MWGALVEHVAAEGEEEDGRLALMDAEAREAVDQALLDRLTGVLQWAAGRDVGPRLIPFGRTEDEQRQILETIAEVVGGDEVSFDLTHGFRHLGIVGMLSAFMLERIGKLSVRSLWYGALDMSEAGVTPVLRLDGLNAIQRWVDALDRFDASGDYGVFAPLLEADGVPRDKARCLEEAAFYERTFNLSDAARRLGTFREVGLKFGAMHDVAFYQLMLERSGRKP
jgi:CRISPR-associated Csx2 family protein